MILKTILTIINLLENILKVKGLFRIILWWGSLCFQCQMAFGVFSFNFIENITLLYCDSCHNSTFTF